MMLLCPHCGSAAVVTETDSSGEWLNCITCGWGKPRDQVIIYGGKMIFVMRNPEEILSETSRTKERTRRRNPKYGKLRL